jgi:lysophospholipid acyltransferase (LPLAT)-like uncharacterized protein
VTKIFKKIALNIAAMLIYFLSKIIYLSCKKEYVDKEKISDLEFSDQPLIYAFWHGRMFPMGFSRQSLAGRKFKAIISFHRDGDLIAKIMSLMGVGAIRGSANRMPGDGKTFKNRGGLGVIRKSIEELEAGTILVITPDGPKGPERKFKQNSLKVAAETGASIIPVSFSASSYFIFKSWDRLIIPKPFSKIIIVFGQPHKITQDENTQNDDLQKHAEILENEINKITDQADNIFQNPGNKKAD